MDSTKFKRALLHFFVNDWHMNTYFDQLRGHRLYIGLENQAWLYEVKDEIVVRTDVPELQCQYREADTRLVLHANHISEKQLHCNLVIRCNDTDMLLIYAAAISRKRVISGSRSARNITFCHYFFNVIQARKCSKSTGARCKSCGKHFYSYLTKPHKNRLMFTF